MALPELPDDHIILHDDGFRSSYFALGPRDGAPMLLLHGLAANSLQFVEDAHVFAGLGYRVIVPDLRGHGRSSVPESFIREDFSLLKLTQDLVAILDAENIARIDWVGNSLGGILGMQMMAHYPERLRSVLMFGTAFKLDIPPLVVNVLAAAYRTIGVSAPATIGAPMTSRFPAAQEVVREMLGNVQVEPMLHVGAYCAQYDLLDVALGFDKAHLMIRAEWDEQVNGANFALLPEIIDAENFQLLELAQAGHCANLDQPEKFREMVEAFVTSDFVEQLAGPLVA